MLRLSDDKERTILTCDESLESTVSFSPFSLPLNRDSHQSSQASINFHDSHLSLIPLSSRPRCSTYSIH